MTEIWPSTKYLSKNEPACVPTLRYGHQRNLQDKGSQLIKNTNKEETNFGLPKLQQPPEATLAQQGGENGFVLSLHF